MQKVIGVLCGAPESAPILTNPPGKLLQELGSLLELHQQPGLVDQNNSIGLDGIEAAGLPHFGPQEFGDDKEPDRFEGLIEFAHIEIDIAIVQRNTRSRREEVQIAFQALAEPIGILPNTKAVIASQATG